nr:immunoglobulin heavy chain junction region [Macaca mulatta]MOX38369.1 immunoglobulin heavy chain junction region [Macaca mulatta]MOX38385.1 immunoglobulin heavy chain junction region [Macaca mulatta]MOX38386.1 immunoglobulin heavy chain junction region [Macaca mulatta]MOX39537.1 immunoglobulin heavy chain junction region [Macaca mulatta]
CAKMVTYGSTYRDRFDVW